MKRFFAVFFLLLLFPLCGLCMEWGVSELTPVACEGLDDGEICPLLFGPTFIFYHQEDASFDFTQPFVYFGTIESWSMVASGTPDSFGPVGWVPLFPVDLSPASPYERELALPVYLLQETPCLASPSEDASVLGMLSPENEYLLLATYQEYGYIEGVLSESPVRAFIPLNAILN